jgi:CBS-domain-containing membrane protein
MALTVRDIMDADPVTVEPGDDVETLVRRLRQHELPGVPVLNEGGRCIGIVTEADLVIADEQGDLNIPHYIELFGGVVFLEPLRRYEARLKKAFASSVRTS